MQLHLDGMRTLDLQTRMQLVKDWILRQAATIRALGSGLSSGLFALWVYGRTMAPGLTWSHHGADGGDLAAALLTGGVPHPSGAPLYLWLGEVFLRLPIANPALALNTLSAISAAGAAALIAYTVARQAPDRLALPAGWIAGLGLAFSPLLWSQAVITELYAPAAFLAALIVGLVVRLAQSKRSALLLGLAQGAGMAIHPSLILLLPLSTWSVWRSGLRRIDSLQFMGGLVIGLLPYAALPLRLVGDAAVNWGRAMDLEGWWWLVSGRIYQGNLFALPISHLPARLSAWARLLLTQFTTFGALLCILGFHKIWLRARSLALAMGASIIGLSIVAIGYDTVDSFYWLIPSSVILAYALGIGFIYLESRFQSRAGKIAMIGLIAALLIVWQLGAHWSAIDASQDFEAQRFVDRTLQEAPRDALLVTQQDQHTFALWYTIYGLGNRSDLHVVDQDLWSFDWYREGVRQELGTNFDLDRADEFQSAPICLVEQEGTLACR